MALKKFLLSTVLTMLLTMISARSFAAEEVRSYFPPVLIYHDVKPRVVIEGFDVSIEEFRYQLDWLKAHGWRTLSTDEFAGYLERGEAFPKKSVLITFDDDYGGVIRYAAPELEARGMNAAFFVIVDSIGEPLSRREYYHASADELKALASNPNFALESHTMSHPEFLTRLSDEELEREVVESKARIEELSGRSVKLFSYPCGDYDQRVIDAVINAGYSAAVIVDVLDAGEFDRPLRWTIPRINMGVAVGAEGHKRFKKFMRNYKSMSDEEFEKRWARLPH